MNNTQTEDKILQVPIEDIIPNRFQPRLSFNDDALTDLAASIKQHGIIQPLVLRRKNDKYEIIAGERRYKAARMAGLLSVPAIISNLSDQDSAEVAIVENVQRKDLTAIEEAKSYQTLLEKGYMTQEELAKKMGLSQSAISNKLRLLTLDESVQQAVIKEQISERHARSLLKIKDPEMQKILLNKIITERLTVKQLEDEIKKINGVQGNSTPSVSVSENYQSPTTIKAVSVINDILNSSKSIENTSITSVDTISTKQKEEVSTIHSNQVKTEHNQSQNDIDDIPLISNMPNIENIVNNAVDISSLNQNISSNNEGGNIVNQTSKSNAPFSTAPEKVPNRFFNFLESQAANLDLEDPNPVVENTQSETSTAPVDLLNKTDNIEMLDDFIIPDNPTDNSASNNDYLSNVIKTVRSLNFDSDKVVIEEMNLPTEYHITIKIKKDKI